MSREFLLEVLEKFAQVTSIIVETSKIKEDLDNYSRDRDLDDILERTKVQVANLHDHATSVKKLLEKNKDIHGKNGVVNGTEGDADFSEQSDSDKNFAKKENEDSSQSTKPLIKLVDIKKLVEPRELIREQKKHVPKHVQIDDSVVVITSSDDETTKSKPKKSESKSASLRNISKPRKVAEIPNSAGSVPARNVARRKAAEKTIEKNRKLQVYSTSSSGSSGDEFVSKKTKQRKNARQELEEVKLANSSSGSDISDSNVGPTGSSNQKSKKEKCGKEKEPDNVCLDKTEAEDTEEPSWKADPKIKCEPYVKVVRVPCEELKEYYLEKLELLEINKLRDLTSLKRKRRRSKSDLSSGNSTSSNEDSHRNKKKPSTKKTTVAQRSDSTSDDSDAKQDNVEPADSATEPLGLNPDLVKANVSHEMAEDALNLLNSDKEENVEASDKEQNEEEDTTDKGDQNEKVSPSKEQEEEKEKQVTASDAENRTDAELPNKKGGDNVEKETRSNEEKESSVSEAATDAKEKEDAKSEDNTNEKESGSESDDTRKKKNTSKSAWKKDKLLISSTDSEEELEKFKKKQDKIKKQKEDESSDDKPKLSKDKSKRVKKRRKKAVVSDSDSDHKKSSTDDESESSSSSSESEKEEKMGKGEDLEKKKPRKRVKRVRDSSDDDDDERSTRKQIRNIWANDSLAETTKKAEAEEKERKARISEKQKKYNQIYESDSKENARVEKVVLDVDEKNQKELLRVDDFLVSKLKPHQASGVQFMWDACFESLERAKKTIGSGCILAHCMGLGKTLQVITLSHTLLVNNEETNVKKVLVVCPLNTVLNWVSEFKQWVPDNEDYDIYEVVSFKQNYERLYQVKTWHENGGVLIIGYDMFRNLSNPENKRLNKKMRTTFQEALVDPGPDLVICDEGHLLKNEKTNLSIAMNRIKSLRRIVLTGTPLQNNLKEYFCMVQFIKPNLLGTYKEYLNRFVNPITNGQYTDSTPHDIQIMRKRSHVLHKMLDGVVQRRDYSVLAPYLPPKFEYVLFLSLTETQIKLYRHYMDHFARRTTDGSNRTSFLFVDFQALQRICTHPRVLLDKSIEMKQAKELKDDSEEDSEGSLRDFIDDDDEDGTASSSSNSSSENDGDGNAEKKKRSSPRKRVTRAAAARAKDNGEDDPIAIDHDKCEEKEWWQQYCDGDDLNVIAHSSKLFLLFEILKECEQIGDKVLVFSQSLYSLNVIEYFLGRVHDATQAGDTDSVGGYSGSWCLGLDYFRLDGSSSCDNRSAWCKTFNNPSNTQARLFLISTRAGGLGINLVAANRVIIFDVSWNPSHDIQSIYRVYRFGQTKPSYIYRFVTLGTMEMKIYERQVTKQAISKRVIDEQQIDRHYNQNDLAELYRFEPDPGERPIPLVPKDVLLGELLQKFEDKLYKYHEHQSLLENKQEECLNEEERKAAWEEFENEKKQRTNFGSGYMRANMMEMALAKIMRQENPTWTEIQIKGMLPTLHAELQEQVARGDLTLYKRVQQEIQIIQAVQTQKLKEHFYQQQLRELQQRQMMEAMKMQGNFRNNLMSALQQMPGTSRSSAGAKPGEVIIDLND